MASDTPHLTSAASGPRHDVLVEVALLQNPSPFVADGRLHLLYELHLTNHEHRPLTLSAIEVDKVSLPAPPRRLRSFTGDELAGMIEPVGQGKPFKDTLTLRPGARNTAYIMLSFATAAEVPSILAHRLLFQPSTAGQPEGQSVPLWMSVASIKPLVLGPPARGERWVAANAVSNTSAHRRTPLVIHGHLYYAQRYAVDLVQLWDDLRGFKDDPSKLENWRSYKHELLAVADGVVVDTRDGIPENVPFKPPVVDITLETVAGNYAVIQLESGQTADYAHMIPGSLRVWKGTHVRRGDVIGLLGNSGNSTAPHLHFHVTDRPSFIEADGIPYYFERFRAQKASIRDAADDFRVDMVDARVRDVTDELVMEDDLIEFYDR